jgi:hypothetical protein
VISDIDDIGVMLRLMCSKASRTGTLLLNNKEIMRPGERDTGVHGSGSLTCGELDVRRVVFTQSMQAGSC